MSAAVATTGGVIRNKDGNYVWDNVEYPSVTTILGGIEEVGLDKGFGYIFGNWTAKEAERIMKAHLAGDDFMRPAGWVLQDGKYVRAYEPMNVVEMVMSGDMTKHLSKVGARELNCAADRGTLVHHAVGCLVRGMDITGSDVISQFSDGLWPDDLAEGCIEALLRWWGMHEIEAVASEISGLNTELGYGGTLDLVAKINGEPYLIDFKTADSARLDHVLQTAAYRKMDIWLENDGKELQPVPAHPMVAELPCLIILVRPERVRCYRIEPETAEKWYGQFKKLFDLKKGWSMKGQTKRLQALQWEAF